MSLDHILLGMLERPAAGYDLGREFDSSARLFWAAELSQIYPTLKRLESKGLLVSNEVPSDRGPNRKVYRRTEAGARVLEDWLREEPELGHARLPYVAQFYFLGALDDLEASSEFVRRMKLSLEQRIAVYREIERCMGEEDGGPSALPHDGFHRYATLRAGTLVAEARLKWCEETLEALEARGERVDGEMLETGVV